MASVRLFQSWNRLPVQYNYEELQFGSSRVCRGKNRLCFLPYEGFGSLNGSVSFTRGSIRSLSAGVLPSERVEKMGSQHGEGNIALHIRLDHQVRFGEHHAILGSTPTLGSWKKKVMMSWTESGWILDLETRGGERVEFKFVIVGKDGKVKWEGGHNRV